MSYVYSESQNRFYPQALQDRYEAAGTWPTDAQPVTDEVYRQLVAERPPEKRLQVVPGAMPTLVDPVPTADQLRASLTVAVQRHMDTAAAIHGYDDIKSAVTYADEPAVERFQREGMAFRAWRSLVWDACYTVMAAVESGEREIPTVEQLFAELPALTIPAAPAVEGE